MKYWNVYYNGKLIDRVSYDYDSADDVRQALINHDMWCDGHGNYYPYPDNIIVILAKK